MLMLHINKPNMRRFMLSFAQFYKKHEIWKLNTTSFHSNTYLYCKNDAQKDEVKESILQEIKSTTDTVQLFEALATSTHKLSSEEVVESFKLLFNLQKSGNSTLKTSDIIKHPQFENLCRNLRTTSRSLDVNSIIDMLKILSFIGISSKSEIVHILLNILRRQINDVTLSQITFLDFILRKFDHSPLIEALQIALPMVLQIQLRTQIDHENVPELVDLLAFASRNELSDPCTTSIVTALTLHGTQLKIDEAKSIVWSLCDMQNFRSQYERLLKNAIEVLVQNYQELSHEILEGTLSKVMDRYVRKNEAFYDEKLFMKCASSAIQRDIGFAKINYLLKKFNKINFVSIELLDYVAEKIMIEPKLISKARPNAFFTVVTGFAIANYQPQQWDVIKTYIMENPVLGSDKSELPWMKFCIELMALDCFDKNLLEKVFNDDFLEKYLAREQNFLDYLQFLSLYQSVMLLRSDYDGKLPNSRFIDKAMELNVVKDVFPLKASLEYVFGGQSFVATKLTTKFGHFVHHAIVFNENNEPVEVNNNENKDVLRIEDLCSDSQKLVAVLSLPKSCYAVNFPRLKGIFDLQIRSLEALGISVVAVNHHQWSNMPDSEKLFYLEREIKHKLKDAPHSKAANVG